jgi:hypothetical protein
LKRIAQGKGYRPKEKGDKNLSMKKKKIQHKHENFIYVTFHFK